jgi:hypothetical protein
VIYDAKGGQSGHARTAEQRLRGDGVVVVVVVVVNTVQAMEAR